MSRVKFAVVVDGEVAATITYDTTMPFDHGNRMIAAMSSDPKIVRIDNDPGVTMGWKYVDEKFEAN